MSDIADQKFRCLVCGEHVLATERAGHLGIHSDKDIGMTDSEAGELFVPVDPAETFCASCGARIPDPGEDCREAEASLCDRCNDEQNQGEMIMEETKKEGGKPSVFDVLRRLVDGSDRIDGLHKAGLRIPDEVWLDLQRLTDEAREYAPGSAFMSADKLPALLVTDYRYWPICRVEGTGDLIDARSGAIVVPASERGNIPDRGDESRSHVPDLPWQAAHALLRTRDQLADQIVMWGMPNHGHATWVSLLAEEMGKVAKAANRLSFGEEEALSVLSEEATSLAAISTAFVASLIHLGGSVRQRPEADAFERIPVPGSGGGVPDPSAQSPADAAPCVFVATSAATKSTKITGLPRGAAVGMGGVAAGLLARAAADAGIRRETGDGGHRVAIGAGHVAGPTLGPDGLGPEPDAAELAATALFERVQMYKEIRRLVEASKGSGNSAPPAPLRSTLIQEESEAAGEKQTGQAAEGGSSG